MTDIYNRDAVALLGVNFVNIIWVCFVPQRANYICIMIVSLVKCLFYYIAGRTIINEDMLD
jgi:hypothetical protein